MKEPTNDGVSAFPCIKNMVSEADGSSVKTYYGVTNSVGGMSLRDYFAACALQGLLLANQRGRVKRNVAKSAYDMADAMLKQRSKQ